MQYYHPAFHYTNDNNVRALRLAAYRYAIGDTDMNEFRNETVRVLTSNDSETVMHTLCLMIREVDRTNV